MFPEGKSLGLEPVKESGLDSLLMGSCLPVVAAGEDFELGSFCTQDRALNETTETNRAMLNTKTAEARKSPLGRSPSDLENRDGRIRCHRALGVEKWGVEKWGWGDCPEDGWGEDARDESLLTD
jgi:hypothetical protein